MSIHHLLFTTLLLSPLASALNKCYFPNGTPSTDSPCDPNALFTQCCDTSSKCLSNGLCLVEVKNFLGDETTGTQCTDKTWASSLCPQQCQLNQDTPRNSSAYDFGAGGVQVWQCTGQGFKDEAKYCCESRGEQQKCCQTQSVVFELQGAVRGASTTNTLGRTSESGQTTSVLAPSITAFVPSQSASTTASVATTSATGPAPASSRTKATGIGVGVGVGVALLFLIAGIIFVVRRRKLKERGRRVSEPSVGELHGSALSKHPVEVWTQPAEMWTEPQELPAEPRNWEMSGGPRTPRQV